MLAHSPSLATDEMRAVNGRLLVASLQARRREEMQIALRAEAEAALMLRDQLMAVAAHELGAPVAGIRLASELALALLEEVTPDRPRVVGCLRGIVADADRLAALVSELLDGP